MTGKQALKRLRAAGWQIVKNGGRHIHLEKGGLKATVPFGSLSSRAEGSLKRLLRKRPTAGDAINQTTELS